MQKKLTSFIDGLILYDFILFASIFGLFILFLIITILLRKRTGLAIFFLFISFSILIAGSTVGYIQMHKYLFKNQTLLTSQKKLTFTKAIVVKGTIKNDSKFDLDSCKITYSLTNQETDSISTYTQSISHRSRGFRSSDLHTIFFRDVCCKVFLLQHRRPWRAYSVLLPRCWLQF